jgi:hypothetical protein
LVKGLWEKIAFYKMLISKKLINRFFGSLILLIILCSFEQNYREGDLQPQKTFIVIPHQPDALESKSASLLHKWLTNIYHTDTGFEVVRENFIKEISGEVIISIGKTTFNSADTASTLSPYAFAIKRRRSVISIKGATALGTLIGTGYFLDHFCGVRFYIPGDLFTSVPATGSVNLDKKISVKETPFTKYVYSTGYKNGTENSWAQINGLLRKDWGSHQHSMGDRFYNDSIFKLFPEIFPIIHGKKYFPKSKGDQSWEPDFAEPKLVDAAVYATVDYFKKNPTVDYISFSVQDSWTYPTEGKMGVFLRNYPDNKKGKYQGYTDAYISFLNNLAGRLKTELPANGISWPRTIVYLVYGNVRIVPSVKLNPAILPVAVYHLSDGIMDDVDGALKEWPRVTKRIGNHDWAEGRGFIYPRIYTKILSNFVRIAQAENLSFDYAHLEFYPNWSLDGPKYYFMSKIYWNPKADPDSLLTLFCVDMFGNASKQMKKYFLALEDLNTSMNNDPKRNRRIGGYITQVALNDKEIKLVQEARSYLNKAGPLASTDNQKERIDLFSKGFKISESFFNLYNSSTLDMNEVTELKDYLKNTVSGNQMMLNMATEKDFIDKINLAVDQVVKARK